MYFDSNQLAASLFTVFFAFAVGSAIALQRGRAARWARRYGPLVIGVCAVVALWSWMRFGEMHHIYVDAQADANGAVGRRKIERRAPFHFHEFFHYYLGGKYFRQTGYESLYDCVALADNEIAAEQKVPPRVHDWVRRLDDVLTDHSYDAALDHCRTEVRPTFSDARWAQFKDDIRELQRLVPDDWWGGATYDAGFNPPPTWVLLGGTLANIIPIRLGGLPTYLLATSLDALLLIGCFFAIRAAFGSAAATTAAVFFGASFIASYGWNGGAYLRYTWIAWIVFALAAMRRGRWVLAGALMAASACDRIFPLGFGVGAMIPMAVGAVRSPRDRANLIAFGKGFAGAGAGLVVVSAIFLGVTAWKVFFQRIFHHGDVYFVMHIGLKKLITWNDWVTRQNFHGHDGLARFKTWNDHLHEAWASMRWLAIPIQLGATALAVYACARRKPYEASILLGIVFMFFFNIPANYYYVVVVLVPALLLRAAAVQPNIAWRYREYIAYTGFVAFWICTFIAPNLYGDDIVYNHFICAVFCGFLVLWMLMWSGAPSRVRAALVGARG